MKIQYNNKHIEKQCTNFTEAQKLFGKTVADKLHAAIQFIIAAETLQDIKNFPPFRLHSLQGKRQGQFAIDLGKKSGWRVILIPLDHNGEQWVIKDIQDIYFSTKMVIIQEVTKHYE